MAEDGGENNREELEQLRSEYQRDQVSYIRRYKSLQESYQALIDLAMQLVEALEDSLQGRQVSEEYISSMCRRLFGVSARSLPAQDPAAGASLLRASIASHSDRLEAGVSHSVPLFPSLDLQRVKSDLSSLEGREVPLLLQALRTRLTQSVVSFFYTVMPYMVPSTVVRPELPWRHGWSDRTIYDTVDRPLPPYKFSPGHSGSHGWSPDSFPPAYLLPRKFISRQCALLSLIYQIIEN